MTIKKPGKKVTTISVAETNYTKDVKGKPWRLVVQRKKAKPKPAWVIIKGTKTENGGAEISFRVVGKADIWKIVQAVSPTSD